MNKVLVIHLTKSGHRNDQKRPVRKASWKICIFEVGNVSARKGLEAETTTWNSEWWAWIGKKILPEIKQMKTWWTNVDKNQPLGCTFNK